MHPSVAPLAAIYDLDTDLLLNCLDGLTEEEARRRLPGGGNSIAFLAAHLADTRHFIANRLGHPLHNPLSPFLADARSIDEVRSLPPLDRIRDVWLAVSDHLASVLEGLTAEDLARTGVHRFPMADPTATRASVSSMPEGSRTGRRRGSRKVVAGTTPPGQTVLAGYRTDA